MKREQVIWPIVLISSCVMIWVEVMLGNTNPFRVALTLWFFFVCPGMAYIQSLQIKGLLERWALALALSIIIDMLVALAILYANIWSYILGLNIVIVITLTGTGIYLYRLWMRTHQKMSPSAEES
jgi:hypothetical protein